MRKGRGCGGGMSAVISHLGYLVSHLHDPTDFVRWMAGKQGLLPWTSLLVHYVECAQCHFLWEYLRISFLTFNPFIAWKFHSCMRFCQKIYPILAPVLPVCPPPQWLPLHGLCAPIFKSTESFCVCNMGYLFLSCWSMGSRRCLSPNVIR